MEETILTEVVANALDSGTTAIELRADPPTTTLTVIDNGSGMSRRELARYHDIATSGKRRGAGIGFAGVGIKLGLLVSDDVTTETRRGQTHVATSWRLASRQKAPWRWISTPDLVPVRGTAVALHLTNALSPLLDPGFLEATLRRHFEPLLRDGFEEVLADNYPEGIRFLLNGTLLRKQGGAAGEVSLAFRVGRRRKPAAVGFMLRSEVELPEERFGIAVSTRGKVIRRGWDWLGVVPAAAERVSGLIEVPALAACLTLNKADFLRTGERGAVYLAYRRAIQEQVGAQLAAWGQAAAPETAKPRRMRPLERDLRSVLTDLTRKFPLLAALVDRGPGGQRKLPLPEADGSGGGAVVPGAAAAVREPVTAPETSAPHEESLADDSAAESSRQPAMPAATAEWPDPLAPRRRTVRRPAHYRLTLQFESRADDDGLARLAESTVWINLAHPAYRRAAASRAEGYHLAVAVAMALAPLAVSPAEAHTFISSFLARWGAAADGRRRN